MYVPVRVYVQYRTVLCIYVYMYSRVHSTVLEDQWDYDHSPRWKKSLDGDRPPPVILTLIVQSIVIVDLVVGVYRIIM